MVADPMALLNTARAVLDGRTALPSTRRARAGAILARTAVEAMLNRRLAQIAADLGVAGVCLPEKYVSGRVKLICLRTLDDGQDARQLAWAWSALSNACHHHSYELSPSASEIEHLVTLVEECCRPTR